MGYRYVYLVFTKTGTWLSNLIHVFSRMKYTHASISFDDSFTKMYSFGRINPDNPFSGGFVEENLQEGVYKKHPMGQCLIYKVRVTEEQYRTLVDQVHRFIVEKDHLKYNFIGLFGVMLNLPVKRKNHYFCSQFVSEILMDSKVFDCGKAPELMTPSDLFLIRDKDVVWQGSVHDFRQLRLSRK